MKSLKAGSKTHKPPDPMKISLLSARSADRFERFMHQASGFAGGF